MTREIILEGSRCRVGNGRHIEVASHKWLPHAPIFLGPLPSPLYVRDLIDVDTRQWDHGKTQALFALSTRQEILVVPLINLSLLILYFVYPQFACRTPKNPKILFLSMGP